jgi:hypothetical protein
MQLFAFRKPDEGRIYGGGMLEEFEVSFRTTISEICKDVFGEEVLFSVPLLPLVLLRSLLM